MCGAVQQEKRVVLPNLSRTGHLRGLDSFPDIVRFTHRKVTAYKLLPTTPTPYFKYSSTKKKKERKQKASRLGIHCAICFQCDLQLAACDCTYSFVRDISKYIALVNFCRVQSYSLETLFLLPLVKGHYIKQGYSKPPFPKKLRGINETALRHF